MNTPISFNLRDIKEKFHKKQKNIIKYIKLIFPFIKYRWYIYENLEKIAYRYNYVIFIMRRQKLVTPILGTVFTRSTRKIEIDITYRCNLNCEGCNRSCSQATTEEQMSVAQIKKFVEESVKHQIRWEKIGILGGEPTLHGNLLEIINILLVYKQQYCPNALIILATNGVGNIVNNVLSKVSGEILIDNSKKNVKYFSHTNFNNAPADYFLDHFTDYSNGCFVSSQCGMGLSPYGYYCCPIAAGIDRIFGFNIGRKNLPAEGDLMKKQMRIFCRLCGHFFQNNPFNKRKISPIWKRAYAQYNLKKPYLTLY